MESNTKKQERRILMIYFFVMLGVGLFLGKTLNDIFLSERDPENIYQNLGCEKILREDQFYIDHGHSDWVERCIAERSLPF